ncbi:MAG TPA: HEAT repeat domain-containing protein [Nocardioides sp.]|nr:HEAT repeat domain-containing protein [Nocardioides sp.]
MTVGHIGYWAAVIIGLGCLTVVVSLVVIRLHADRDERRTRELRTPLWRVVLTLSAGDPDEVEEARRRLLALTPTERSAVESDVFALVPKLRGESRERVRDVLRAWGSVDQARNSTASASPVRRARGYYRLGVLGLADRRDDVLAGLDDRDFTARRTAMLALASFPEPAVIEAMLAAAATEPRLRHDFLAAVDQVGEPAAAVLVRRLDDPATDSPVREQWLAAEALGLVGGYEALPALEACLKEPDEELRIAALGALGELGAPSSMTVVASQLADTSSDVRRAATTAAGMIGGPSALLVLEIGLRDEDVEVARTAATALRRGGAAGRTILESVPVPVAREALALADLRAS